MVGCLSLETINLDKLMKYIHFLLVPIFLWNLSASAEVHQLTTFFCIVQVEEGPDIKARKQVDLTVNREKLALTKDTVLT